MELGIEFSHGRQDLFSARTAPRYMAETRFRTRRQMRKKWLKATAAETQCIPHNKAMRISVYGLGLTE
jgi:hypothetical protein